MSLSRFVRLGAFFSLLQALAFSAELTVHAASSLSDALRELAPKWEQASGHRLRLSFGGSGTLARQIREGIPGDVFFAADEARMDQLEEAGLLVPATRRALLGNRLVLVVAAGDSRSFRSAEDLSAAPLRRLVLGEPASVPAGTYAKAWLQACGQWDALKDRTVLMDSVRAVLGAVVAGNAEAGFVFRSDALSSSKVRVALEVSGDKAPVIVYPAAVLASSRSAAEAKDLVAWLAGDEAQAVFRRHGFLSPP